MASKSTLFTVAGITTHARAGVTVTKVRYGTDLTRLIKMLNSNRKIGVSYALGGREDGFLDAVRVDLVELPTGMLKADALKFLATHEQFQSAEDQATIAEEVGKREPKQPRVKAVKEVKVKVTKAPKSVKTAVKATPSLDAIKMRSRKRSDATVGDVLAAVQAPAEVVATPEVAE